MLNPAQLSTLLVCQLYEVAVSNLALCLRQHGLELARIFRPWNFLHAAARKAVKLINSASTVYANTLGVAY